MRLIDVETDAQIERCRELFLAYADSLDFNLCFQNFEKELKELPGDYAPPYGRLLLLEIEGQTAGCIALRKIDDQTGEMKRLYVVPEFRKRGAGSFLVESVITEARKIGYKTMKLDTVNTMKEAVFLYRSYGFRETLPYRHNPLEGVIYMELNIQE